MAVHKLGGTKLYIANPATPPASPSPWTEIGEVTNLGDVGRVYEMITHSPISTRGVKKFKGSYNDGSMQLVLGRDLTDAGQDALDTALNSDSEYNFQIRFDDAAATPASPVPVGSKITFKALVMSFPTTMGEINSVVGRTCTLEIVSGSIVVTDAVPAN